MTKPYHSTLTASICDAKSTGFTIDTFEIRGQNGGAGHYEENIPWAFKELFRVIWVRKGAGVLYVDMNSYTIGDDVIYCLKPGQALKLDPLEETSGYTLSFSTDFLTMAGNHAGSLYQSPLFHPLSPFSIISVNNSLKPEMLEITEKMIRESANAYAGKDEILRGLLKIFLVYLNRQQEESQAPVINLHQSGLASKFFGLLEKNFANRKMVSDYAQDLSVTPNYLNEAVKRASGFPASFHIQQRIILEAKRRAAYVRASMKEIAYDLGFDDISHFSKYFKKVSGVSFTDFRKEISHQFSFAAGF